MKILYFLAHPDNLGGATKVLLTQAYLAHEIGHTVKIVIQNNLANEHTSEYDILCNRYKLDYIATQYPIATCIEEINILDVLDKYENICKIIKNYMPDVIHSVQLNIVVELCARKLNIPHIMNIYPISEGMFNIEWSNVFAKYHSCDSNFFCDRWREGLHIESRCIRVAYEPTNCQLNMRDDNYDYHVINIATFAEYKRQLYIIRFIELCKKRGINLHIDFVGYNTSKYGELCKKYVLENNLSNNVTFVGIVSNIEKYLAEADFMVHISTMESYPGVIVEAMANRVPVIATPVAGVPELVKTGINGFLTEGYDVESVYEAFLQMDMCFKEGKIQFIQENAFKTYIENHSYDAVKHHLEECYRHIISDNIIKSNNLEIEDISIIFNKFDISNYSSETVDRLWFLYHLKNMLKKSNKKTCLIWGAGKMGKIALEWTDFLELQMIGYIDIFKSGKYMDMPIYRPDDEIVSKTDMIIVAVYEFTARENIMYEMEKKGKVRNQDYILMFNDPCLISRIGKI